MEFSNLNFLFRFLPIFILVYYLSPARWKNGVLFLGSILFYAFGEPLYVFLLLVSVGLHYFAAWCIKGMKRHPKKKQRLLAVLIVFDVGMLLFFKYTSYRMPLGFSFFTFTVLSYILDIYMGKCEPERSFAKAGIYMMLFPKLISGPIASYRQMYPELERRRITFEETEQGLMIFTIGLGFKVIFADHFGMLWNEIQTAGFDSISTPLAWIGAAGYSAQLFFDFQGYSLMAIGVGRMIGFHLPKNFDHPYRAKSVAEFYRRWHITLGRWFRDYLYIPLGGNRGTMVRTVCNLLLVWFVTGMWHGSTANFILWGMVLGLLVVLEKCCLKKFLNRHPVVAHLYILLVIPMTWIVFAITKIREVGVYFTRLFPFWGSPDYVNQGDFMRSLGRYGIFFVLAFLVSLPFVDKLYEKYKDHLVTKLLLLVVFWYCVYKVANGMNNPFLYFQF